MNDLRNTDRVGAAIRFATDTVEVIRLKLRIIGFSNKLTGLYARLGEAAFLAEERGERLTDNDPAKRLMIDIREAQREIKEAEEGIDSLRLARHEPSADESSPVEQTQTKDVAEAADVVTTGSERKEG